MYCTECHHEIPTGRECLSQMPHLMPENFRRRKFENFCIDCAECSEKMGAREQSRRPCFSRRLDHWYTHQEKTREPVDCGYCGETIPVNTGVVSHKLYAWPAPDARLESEIGSNSDRVGSAASVGVVASRSSGGGWHNLSRVSQGRFETGGLGRGLGARSPAMARRLYEKEVPKAIRNLGEPAVKDFLKGKHFSHIKSVAKVPAKAKAPSNVILEDAGANLSRSSRNMTSAGHAAAKSASRSAAVRIGAKATAKSAAKAGIIAAALDAAASVPENFLHWKRGRKSGEEAVKDTAKSAAVASGVGAVTAGVAKAATMAGIGLSLGPAATPVAVAGVGLMIGTTAYRLIKAAKHDLPLDEYYLFFCKNSRCKTRFAKSVTDSARGVGNGTFPWTWAMVLAGLLAAIVLGVLALT